MSDAAAQTGTGPHAMGQETLETFADTPRINRWMYGKFREHVRGSVLEVGAGIGNLSARLVADADRALLTDMEPAYVARLQARFAGDPRVEVAQFELGEEPPAAVASRRFDAILAVNVLEHVRDDLGAARCLAGLLKPGGHLLVYVPACSWAYGSLDRELCHVRRYSARGLTSLLAGAGLVPGPARYMNLLSLPGWVWVGRVLRSRRLSTTGVRIAERLAPALAAIEGQLPPPIGLGVTCSARKPVD